MLAVHNVFKDTYIFDGLNKLLNRDQNITVEGGIIFPKGGDYFPFSYTEEYTGKLRLAFVGKASLATNSISKTNYQPNRQKRLL